MNEFMLYEVWQRDFDTEGIYAFDGKDEFLSIDAVNRLIGLVGIRTIETRPKFGDEDYAHCVYGFRGDGQFLIGYVKNKIEGIVDDIPQRWK